MTIPNNNRQPFTFIEFDPSRATKGPSILDYKVLIFGQKTVSGTKSAGTIHPITSSDIAAQYFGAASMLHLMFVSWFKNNKVTKVYAMALDDAGGAVAATGTIVISGTATAAGSINVYVAGKKITVSISIGDTATVIAAAIASAVNANLGQPTTAANVTGTVTFTARNLGLVGNDIVTGVNLGEGEYLPAGITSTAGGALSSGATNPSLSAIGTVLGETWFNMIIGPLVDHTNLDLLNTELISRFDASRQIDAQYIAARRGSLAVQTTFGLLRNSPHMTVFDAENFPSWTPEIASAAGGQIAISASADPALPLHTIPLQGILPPAVTARRTYADNNALLYVGISPFIISSDGTVRLSTVITNYRTNAIGADDTSYLFYTTMATLSYLRFSLRTRFQLKYARAKIADDGNPIPSGQTILTPKGGYAECIAWFQDMQSLALVENLEQFKNDLVVQRAVNDPTRMNFNLSPDLMNGYITGAFTFQFLN